MKKRRSFRVVGVALLAGIAMTFPIAQAAGAKSIKVPKYAGAAPGLVSCSLSAKIVFSTPLTDSGAGAAPSKFKGTLSGCSTTETGATVTITKGTVTGSFASSPLSCITKSATGAPLGSSFTGRARSTEL